ncbi:MAG: hypothetical protein IJA81_07220 [Akkermansia sp.]|nr:hypothetical protein [Akkermansia sp.]
MKLSTIILASACYAATLPTYAQEPAQAPAPTRMQYENWQQLPPQVRAALRLFAEKLREECIMQH